MAKARIERRIESVKNRIAAQNGDLLMDSTGDLSSLRYQLESEKTSYTQYLSQSSALSSGLSQSKTQLTELQKQHTVLEAQKKQQEELVAKVNSYLSDFKPAFEPGSDELFSKIYSKDTLEEEAKKLAGELEGLTME